MEKVNEIKKSATIMGVEYHIDKNLNLITPDKTLSANDMREISKEWRSVNRIKKPPVLLFWADVKNGKQSKW